MTERNQNNQSNQNQIGRPFGVPALGSMPTNQSTRQVFPVRWIVPPGSKSKAPIVGYTGPGLVGRSNTVESDNPYEITEDLIQDIYASLNEQTRPYFQSVLKRKGFYGNSKPGVPQNDFAAIRDLLDYANTERVTWDRAVDEANKKLEDYSTGGSGRRYRVSNPDDIRVAVNRAAQDTIGRSFTEQELALVIPGFQKAQVQGQMGAVEAPGADVFAEQAARFLAPTEANAYKFLGIMDRIFSATSGGM